MDKEQSNQIDPVAKHLQEFNEDIKNELKFNPYILSKEAFMDALRNNFAKFIQDNYRD